MIYDRYSVRRFAGASLGILLLCSCQGSSSAKEEYTQEGTGGVFTRAEFDEDKARDDAVDQLSGESFQDAGDTSSCTDDCGGHDAGFEWAKEHGFTDASECSDSESDSFREGCEAYAAAIEQSVQEKRDEFEGEDDASGED